MIFTVFTQFTENYPIMMFSLCLYEERKSFPDGLDLVFSPNNFTFWNSLK